MAGRRQVAGGADKGVYQHNCHETLLQLTRPLPLRRQQAPVPSLQIELIDIHPVSLVWTLCQYVGMIVDCGEVS